MSKLSSTLVYRYRSTQIYCYSVLSDRIDTILLRTKTIPILAQQQIKNHKIGAKALQTMTHPQIYIQNLHIWTVYLI